MWRNPDRQSRSDRAGRLMGPVDIDVTIHDVMADLRHRSATPVRTDPRPGGVER
jgi:hypothetical protein